MHSQRVGVPQGSPSDKWLSAKRRKWIPFKPALTGLLAVFVLALQFFTGLYLFVLPFAAKWRSSSRAD